MSSPSRSARPRAAAAVLAVVLTALSLTACNRGADFDAAAAWMRERPGVASVVTSGSIGLFGGSGLVTANVDESASDAVATTLARDVAGYLCDREPLSTSFRLVRGTARLEVPTCGVRVQPLTEEWLRLQRDARITVAVVNEYETTIETDADTAFAVFLDQLGLPQTVRVTTPDDPDDRIRRRGPGPAHIELIAFPGDECGAAPQWLDAVHRYTAERRLHSVRASSCGSASLLVATSTVVTYAVEERTRLLADDVEGRVRIQGGDHGRAYVTAIPAGGSDLALAAALEAGGYFTYDLSEPYELSVRVRPGTVPEAAERITALPGSAVFRQIVLDDDRLRIVSPPDRVLDRAVGMQRLLDDAPEIDFLAMEALELTIGLDAHVAFDGAELARLLHHTDLWDAREARVDFGRSGTLRIVDGSLHVDGLHDSGRLRNEADDFIAQWELLEAQSSS